MNTSINRIRYKAVCPDRDDEDYYVIEEASDREILGPVPYEKAQFEVDRRNDELFRKRLKTLNKV